MSSHNTVAAIKKIVKDSTPEQKNTATIVSIDDANIQVRLSGSKTITQIKKPQSYNVSVGDVVNVFKNKRTASWQVENGSTASNIVKLSEGGFDADIDLSASTTYSSGIDETKDWIDIDACLIITGANSHAGSIRLNADSGANYDNIRTVTQVDTVSGPTTTTTTTTSTTGGTFVINWTNTTYKILIKGKIRNPGSTSTDEKLYDFQIYLIGGRYAGILNVAGVYKSTSPITSFDINLGGAAGKLLAKNSTIYITASDY